MGEGVGVWADGGGGEGEGVGNASFPAQAASNQAIKIRSQIYLFMITSPSRIICCGSVWYLLAARTNDQPCFVSPIILDPI